MNTKLLSLSTLLLWVLCIVTAVKADDPQINSASSLYFMVGGIVQLTGSNLVALPDNITIGNLPCTGMVLKSDKEIDCYFEATVPPKDYLPVVIGYNSTYVVTHKGMFRYRTDNCGSCKGKCLEGQCVCDYIKVSGIQCDIAVDKGHQIEPAFNSTTSQFASYVATLTELAEIDGSGATVTSLDLVPLTWTPDTQNPLNYTAVSPTGVTVSVLIANSKISDITTDYGGQKIYIPKNSVKHNVNVSNWKFASPDNKMKATYQFTFPQSNSVQPNTIIINDNVQSLGIDSPTDTFVAQFPNRVSIDYYFHIMSIKLVQPSSKPNQVLITLTMPSFTKFAEFDPIFLANTKITDTTSTPPTPSPPGTTTSASSSTPALIWSSIILLMIFVFLQ
eukprot:gene15003-17741_t